MRYGAHLPLIDFDGQGWQPSTLPAYVRTARELGYDTITANDHLVFARPWLDGIVALASVVEVSGDMRLATTISLPVVRGPAALAKAAAALDIVSGGRLILGVGPGSSENDYVTAGVPFAERWPRFDESVRVLRSQLTADAPPVDGRFYPTTAVLEPRPGRTDSPRIWVASWGSDAGLRRVARLGDGWLASAYNATPAHIARARDALAAYGRDLTDFPCCLATMWTYVTDDRRLAQTHLDALATLLKRPAETLAGQVLIGPADECAARLRAYTDAGIDRVFIWPIADAERQLEHFARDVVPLLTSA
jgi:alkanesulfonate monooxygenase SsuD/methylene tetrahydromethanopterin reductase-like flavin-dependent oxidoreductase (luciferase family)